MARDSRNVVNRSSSGGGTSTRREAGDPRQTEDGGNNSSFDYAGPIGMNANPMDGDKVMEKMGDLATRKKKKNPMDMGGMDYAGPESPQGFEGEAGNTFSKEGLDKMNQHYAQTQQSMAAG